MKGRVLKAAACLAIAVLGALSLLMRTPYLMLVSSQTGQILHVVRTCEIEGFSISHIHSLHQSPVLEIYTIRDGQIMLIALEFETFGAGLPEVLEPGQTLTRLETGGLRIDGFERPIADLRYLIGHTAEHTLHLAGQDIPLNTLDCAGQSVRFIPRRLNVWQRLYFKR